MADVEEFMISRVKLKPLKVLVENHYIPMSVLELIEDNGLVFDLIGDVRGLKLSLFSTCNNTITLETVWIDEVLSIKKIDYKEYVCIKEYTYNKLVGLFKEEATISEYADVKNNILLLKVPNTLRTSVSNPITNGTEGNFWLGDNKSNLIKPAKVMRAILNNEKDSTKLESYVNTWRSEYQVDTSIVKVTDDLPMVYNMDHSSSGSIGGSCMRGEGHKYKWLVGSCTVAYITDYNYNGMLVARALIWDTDDGHIFMDRMYYSKEKYKLTLIKWANELGYYHKEEQTTGSKVNWVDSNGDVVKCKNISVNVGELDTDIDYPYMDTVLYYDGNATISNIDGGYIFDSTNGELEGWTSERYTCDDCGDSCDGNYYSEYHGCYICDNCIDLYVYSEILSDYLYYEDSNVITYYDPYGNSDYTTADKMDDIYHCDSSGEYYHIDYYLPIETEDGYTVSSEYLDDLYYDDVDDIYFYSEYNYDEHIAEREEDTDETD